MLVTIIQRQMAALVMELEARQREAERRADELFEELEQELNELQTRSYELQRLEHSANPVHLLQVKHLNCISIFLCPVNIFKNFTYEKPLCPSLFLGLPIYKSTSNFH